MRDEHFDGRADALKAISACRNPFQLKETCQCHIPHRKGYKAGFNEANKAIEELIAEERERVVVDYTDFLIKYGYVDSDVYTEEPKAVERYLSSLDKPLTDKLIKKGSKR